MALIDDMIVLARQARSRAYAPYSRFHVGACLRTLKNNIYTGCNVENASYGLSMCAESTAIGNMVSAGETDIRELVLVGPDTTPVFPCGRCRQQLFEFGHEALRVHFCNADGIVQTITLGELLPYAFAPSILEKP